MEHLEASFRQKADRCVLKSAEWYIVVYMRVCVCNISV